MKKILIIEDDQVVANVYRNKLTVEGYRAETAADGETGLKLLRTFKPQIVILDLMLPGISGVDVIKEIRKDIEFSKVPTVVFSNTYLTNLIQEAWRAGASKCLSKSNCSPKDFIEVVRLSVGTSGLMVPAALTAEAPAKPAVAPPATPAQTDAEFQDDLRKTFIESLPGTLYTLRSAL